MHDKETGERPTAKPGLSGWVEGMDEADDGYLAHGETIDAEPVSRSVNPAAPDDADPGSAGPTASSDPGPTDPVPPPTQPGPSRRPPPARPPSGSPSSATRSGRGRQTRLVGMGLVGLAVVGGLLIARHYTGTQPPLLAPPSVAKGLPGQHTTRSTSASVPMSLPVAPQAAVTAPKNPAKPKSTPKHAPAADIHPAAASPTGSTSTDGPTSMSLPTTDDTTAPSADSRASAHTLDDLHAQLSTLETQMAGMRDKAKSDTAANRELKDQIVALHRALHDVYERMGKLTSGMGSSAAKAHALHGYRLLAVVGSQAVIEELATGKAAVLGANGHLGTLTVYQVNKGQVVTNFGVF